MLCVWRGPAFMGFFFSMLAMQRAWSISSGFLQVWSEISQEGGHSIPHTQRSPHFCFFCDREYRSRKENHPTFSPCRKAKMLLIPKYSSSTKFFLSHDSKCLPCILLGIFTTHSNWTCYLPSQPLPPNGCFPDGSLLSNLPTVARSSKSSSPLHLNPIHLFYSHTPPLRLPHVLPESP